MLHHTVEQSAVTKVVRGRGEVTALRGRFGHWHEAVRNGPDGLDEDDAVLRHDLCYLDPPLPSYVQGNVALIGDAAHAMSPTSVVVAARHWLTA